MAKIWIQLFNQICFRFHILDCFLYVFRCFPNITLLIRYWTLHWSESNHKAKEMIISFIKEHVWTQDKRKVKEMSSENQNVELQCDVKSSCQNKRSRMIFERLMDWKFGSWLNPACALPEQMDRICRKSSIEPQDINQSRWNGHQLGKNSLSRAAIEKCLRFKH